MTHETLQLDADPARALAALREHSRTKPVLVFKRSPICPVSHGAESELRAWLSSLEAGARVALAVVDVIAERPLARGLTSELGLAHESPQALCFRGGALAWHASHGALTRARFARALVPSG